MHGIPTTQGGIVAYALTIDTTNGQDGDSILLDMGDFTGMSTLLINGTYTEILGSNGLYLFTKTTDSDISTGYILRRLCSTGIHTLAVTNNPALSVGRNILTNTQALTLPLAAGLVDHIELWLGASGVVSSVTASGSDTIVNPQGLTYSKNKLTFMPDGVNKWYYNA
jgi:hypothetical protein